MRDRSDISTVELEKYIGKITKISLLHKPWIRKRESYRPAVKRSPRVAEIKNATGQRFKLLFGEDSIDRLAKIKIFAEKSSELGFFPELVASGRNWLLIEFIEGEAPDFSSAKFAIELGECLAKLHNINRGLCESEKIIEHFEKDLLQLRGSNLLVKPAEIDLIRSAVLDIHLKRFPTSLDYFDVKPSNFIRKHDGKLYFVDLGALGQNRPTGQYLYGSLHVNKLDLPMFNEAYLSAGGDAEVVNNAKPLRVMHCIWLAAHYHRRASEIPLYAAPLKYGFQFVARRLVRESLELASDQAIEL